MYFMVSLTSVLSVAKKLVRTMKQKLTNNPNRRGLLRTALRWGVALGAVVGGVGLFRRNRGGSTEIACGDPKGRTGCGSCGLLASCGLPRGLSFKQVRKERADGR